MVFPKKGFLLNYRAISILCIFTKLFEIILYQTIYTSVKNVTSISKHYFSQRRSYLPYFSQFVSEALNYQSRVDTVYLGFQNALDLIYHSVILVRLNEIGIVTPYLSYWSRPNKYTTICRVQRYSIRLVFAIGCTTGLQSRSTIIFYFY